MAVYNYSNTSVETTLASGIVGGSATISLTSSAGLPVSYPYTLILDYGAANVEVVSVTGPSGGSFAVTRGEDGTAAQSHNAGARVVHGVVGRDLKVAQDHIAASTAVHGVAGSVVGHTDTQTLTNKTISGASNTLSNIADASIAALSASKLTGSYGAITSTGAVQGTAVTATTGAVTATAGAVTAGTTVTGQGAGNTAGLVADVPNANTADLLTLKRNSVVKANVDKDGNVAGVNVSASGTLAVTGISTLTGAVTANGGVSSSGTVQGATVNATSDLQYNGASLGRGLIGGKKYTGTANFLTAASGENLFGMDSGSVNLVNGRRYKIVAYVLVSVNTASSDCELYIRDTNLAGAVIAFTKNIAMPAGVVCSGYLIGHYDATATGAKTFVVSGRGSSQTLNALRAASSDQNKPFIDVIDIGPSSAVTSTT